MPEQKAYPTIRMPFGKYRGEAVEDVPSDYLEWCLTNCENLGTMLKKEMEKQLEAREGKGIQRQKSKLGD